MIEEDTVKLLRECDSGIEMGMDSIDDVLAYVSDPDLKKALNKSKDEHAVLKNEIEEALHRFHDDGKDPSPVAQGMSKIKTNVTMIVTKSDKNAADLITDGCNMGIKSLSQYLNQYKAADESAKDIAKKLIYIEENLAKEMRPFL